MPHKTPRASREEASKDPAKEADAATRRVLALAQEGTRAFVVKAPPGAGKTRLVVDLALFSTLGLGERCLVAAPTNRQAQEIARRLARACAAEPVYLHLGSRQSDPGNLPGSVLVTRSKGALPEEGPLLATGTAAKWSWQGDIAFDRLIVDEAYQLKDQVFRQIAGMAPRLALVGDPGQIEPVVQVSRERWTGRPQGPHRAAAGALRRRFSRMKVVRLPRSWRLLPDSARLVNTAFYEDLSFQAAARPGERRLLISPAAGKEGGEQRALRRLQGGSIALTRLQEDAEERAGAHIARMVRLLLERGRLEDRGKTRPLRPADIGITCSYARQVSRLQRRLPRSAEGVLVETADRYQGLEREVMIAWHPLLGRRRPSAFDLSPGRLCVMLSRHRTACLIVAGRDLEKKLERHTARSRRFLGEPDLEHRGWKACRLIARRLAGPGRPRERPL